MKEKYLCFGICLSACLLLSGPAKLSAEGKGDAVLRRHCRLDWADKSTSMILDIDSSYNSGVEVMRIAYEHHNAKYEVCDHGKGKLRIKVLPSRGLFKDLDASAEYKLEKLIPVPPMFDGRAYQAFHITSATMRLESTDAQMVLAGFSSRKYLLESELVFRRANAGKNDSVDEYRIVGDIWISSGADPSLARKMADFRNNYYRAVPKALLPDLQLILGLRQLSLLPVKVTPALERELASAMLPLQKKIEEAGGVVIASKAAWWCSPGRESRAQAINGYNPATNALDIIAKMFSKVGGVPIPEAPWLAAVRKGTFGAYSSVTQCAKDRIAGLGKAVQGEFPFFEIETVTLPLLASCQNHSFGERAGEGGNIKREKDRKVITHKENGREFKITVGETFQVSLPENPTTGYQWKVYKSGAPFVDLEKEEYVEPGEDLAMPIAGRGGTKFLAFKAAKPGETELALRLRRSWEDESKFADFFSVKLKIIELQK